MHYRPPPANIPQALVALLARLQLVDEAQWKSVAPYVRLAPDVPAFESVWIDALRQARLITQFQAAALHAGRGESLQVDRFVLYERTDDCFYAESYRARPLDSDAEVRLTLFPIDSTDHHHSPAEVARQLQRLAEAHAKLHPEASYVVHETGTSGDRGWALGPWHGGLSAAQWLLRRGRCDPATVLEIALAMVADLARLEAAGLCHGNISMHSLVVLDDGRVAMPQAGVRGIVRPSEGFAHLEIRPEACDGLAPERVAGAAPPSIAGDMFACGCLWWHLLCGRPALGGGDSLSRLKAACEGKIAPVGQWVSDVPQPLGEVIADCLRMDPAHRPASFSALSDSLGPATNRGRQRIAEFIRGGNSNVPVPVMSSRRRRRLTMPQMATAASMLVIAAVAFAWPIWVALTHRSAVAAARIVTAARPSPGAKANSALIQAKPRPLNVEATAPLPISGDGLVEQASYLVPANADIVLPSKSAIRCQDIPLHAGCRVTAPRGERLKITVPREGWKIKCEQTCFENVDFIFESAPQPNGSSSQPLASALIEVMADQIEFHRCTFRGGDLSSAIFWLHSAAGQDSALSLPSGRLRIKDSVFTGFSKGLMIDRAGAISLEISNVLCLSGGAFLTLKHCPAADEPVHIAIFAFTLRDSDALLGLDFIRLAEPPGEIAIDATSCVFAGRAGTSVVSLGATDSPEAVLRTIKWTGQGSLLAANEPFAQALQGGVTKPLDDSAANVAGLVRDNVEFAGPISQGIPACRVIGWHAPLQSPDAPGSIIEQLPLPPK